MRQSYFTNYKFDFDHYPEMSKYLYRIFSFNPAVIYCICNKNNLPYKIKIMVIFHTKCKYYSIAKHFSIIFKEYLSSYKNINKGSNSMLTSLSPMP